MDNCPPISVLITSFNQVRYLEEAVNSVLSQTVKPAEIVICDDASTDGSQEFIKSVQRQYPAQIKYNFQEVNSGISVNRNIAFERATQQWIIFLDGDDRLLPKKIESSVPSIAENSSVKMVFSNYCYINEEGQKTGTWANKEEPAPPHGRVFKEIFSKSYPKGSLFRNELIHRPSAKRNGLFDPDMKIYEDWEFRLRFAAEHEIGYVPEVLSEYRLHEGGISRVPMDVHIEYIRKLFFKNVHLLMQLSAEERGDVLSEFLQLEAKFTLRSVKQSVKQLRLFSACSGLLNDLRFRADARRRVM